MHFKLKLDCDSNNPAEVFRHQGAILAALQLHKSYLDNKSALIGTGPELYAEQYMKNCFTSTSSDFSDLVMKYFIKILQVSQNG
jgi:hypothetical protein